MPRKATRNAQGGGRHPAAGKWALGNPVYGRQEPRHREAEPAQYLQFHAKGSPPEAGPDHCLHRQRHIPDPQQNHCVGLDGGMAYHVLQEQGEASDPPKLPSLHQEPHCARYRGYGGASCQRHPHSAPVQLHDPSGPVWKDEAGGHYAIHTFYKRFKAIVASIGRPDARPHDLRHTAATVAIASGADIKSVQDLLGHATASFTLNVYAHTSEQMMKDTAARMQSYYDGLAAKG